MVDWCRLLVSVRDNGGAARFLALSPHSLECYRAKGAGPSFYKFGKAVWYAVTELDAWFPACRHSQTAGNLKRIY